VGGHTKASIRRAARRGDGWQPLGLRGEELREGLSLLRVEAEKLGRDPGKIEITLSTGVTVTTAESIEEARASGVHRLVAASVTGDLEKAKDELSVLAEVAGLQPPSPARQAPVTP
jgi:alkanesulfonate monooxygenase SsuD/methylene tetrahydromethanopterin reductase-like flavin-dependent oxidoreductase (luciferase family)